MNQRSDIDRVLHVWMEDGPSVMPDRIVDVVADRISVQSQRRSWRLLRRLPMNPLLKLGAAAAAVLVLAVVGYNLLPGPSGPGGPSPSPTEAQPTPTEAQPTPTVGSGPLTEGRLATGRYALLLPDTAMTVLADVPAGWQGFPDIPALASPGPADGILIAFMVADTLFSDPCHWDLNGTGLGQPGDVVVGPTVDDLVAALKANTSYTSSAATLVTLGQFEGQELELQLPGDDILSTCDEHGPGSPFTGTAYYVFSNGFYAQGPNSRWHLYIVDVNGTRLITLISILEGTSETEIVAARAIVESFEITP